MLVLVLLLVHVFCLVSGKLLGADTAIFVSIDTGKPRATLSALHLAAFLGHLYPIFFGFRGGKGVATAMGVQLGLYWPIGLSVVMLWLFVAKVLKISSLSALASMSLAPIIVWIFWPEPVLICTQVLISLILFWRHRSNIRNLLSGAEDKISDEPGEEAARAEERPSREGE